jgi:hypothetical protein
MDKPFRFIDYCLILNLQGCKASSKFEDIVVLCYLMDKIVAKINPTQKYCEYDKDIYVKEIFNKKDKPMFSETNLIKNDKVIKELDDYKNKAKITKMDEYINTIEEKVIDQKQIAKAITNSNVKKAQKELKGEFITVVTINDNLVNRSDLWFEFEPDNKFDKNSIKIISNKKDAGYVFKNDIERVKKIISIDENPRLSIEQIYPKSASAKINIMYYE